jgi:hypothetical protein
MEKKIRAILNGAGRMLDITASYAQRDHAVAAARRLAKSDAESLKGDLVRIGDDMYCTLNKLSSHAQAETPRD